MKRQRYSVIGISLKSVTLSLSKVVNTEITELYLTEDMINHNSQSEKIWLFYKPTNNIARYTD